MAAENDTGEKTEEPTGKRLSQTRTEGQVAKSVDLSQIIGLTAAFITLQLLSPILWDNLLVVFRGGLSGKHLAHGPMSIQQMHDHFIGLLVLLMPSIMLLFFVSALFGAGSMGVQTKFLWSKKLLMPKLRNINFFSGVKRLFSLQNAVNVIKAIAKLCVICPIAYFAFFEIFPEFLALMSVPITELLPFTGIAAATIFWRIFPALLVIAILDYAWQHYRWKREVKMTKSEVKDERKAIEGDEKTKRMIQQKGFQRIREKMMQAVPTADVVVTNPTHFAVALKYDIAPGSAPMVVAKGRGYVAERIKKIARENDVPVLERKPLARALYKTAEVGQSIPYELFAAVAELFAYVYKLRGRNPFSRQPNSA